MLPALLLLIALPVPAAGCSIRPPPAPVLLPGLETGETGSLPANGSILVPFGSSRPGLLDEWRGPDELAVEVVLQSRLVEGLEVVSRVGPVDGFIPGAHYNFWSGDRQAAFVVSEDEDHEPPDLEFLSWQGSHWTDGNNLCGIGSDAGVTYHFEESDEPRLIVRRDEGGTTVDTRWGFGQDWIFVPGIPDPAAPHRFVAIDLAGNISDEVAGPPTIACGACGGSVGGPPGGVLLLLLLLRRQPDWPSRRRR